MREFPNPRGILPVSNPPEIQGGTPAPPSGVFVLRHPSAFTILELLVATAVMALMLTLLLQITNHTLQASKTTTQQLDSTQAARQALDALSGDLANALTTDGGALLAQASDGAPSLAFLTYGRGPAPGTRFLAVNYRLKDNRLIRAYNAIEWSSPPGFLAAAETASAVTSESALSAGILQFAVLAVLEDGSMVSLLNPPASGTAWGASGSADFEGQTVPTGWTALVPSRPPLPSPLDPTTARVRSLLVAIASVDEQNLALLSPDQKDSFTQPSSSDPVALWETELASKTFPGPAKAAIHFQSKVISLP
jgi:type II secretory pathway pseudopilin PulG